MIKKRFFIFTILFVAFFLLSTPALESYGATTKADPGARFKTLTIALRERPPTFDPYDHRNIIAQSIVRLWTSGFHMLLPDGTMVKDLATSWDLLDPLTAEVRIRKDVYFHNGDHMTADDVIFSLTRIGTVGGLEGKTSQRRPHWTGEITALEKIDDYGVRIKFGKPIDVGRWFHLALCEIIPKKYFEKVGVQGFIQHPVGAGPFKWVKGSTASEVVLERNENYYGGPPELPGNVRRVPALDRVILKFVPEPSTRVAALLAGDVDIIQDVPTDAIPMLKTNPNIQLDNTIGNTIVVLYTNITKAPFKDKRVRQAIAYAIDYDLIVDKLYGGFSDPMYGRPFVEPHAGQPGFKKADVQHLIYKYDPEKARALMKAAGVSGFSAVIDTIPGQNEEAQIVAQMLGDIGINASVRVWDFAVINEEFKKGKRDMFLCIRGQSGRTPEGTYSATGTGQRFNFSGYSNPTYDDLMKRAIPMEDGPERRALFMEAYKIFTEDVPVLWMHNPLNVDAYRSNVKNYKPHPMGRIKLHRVDIE